MSVNICFGMQCIAFRLFNVNGECLNLADFCRNVIGLFIRCIVNNTSLPDFGNGDRKRPIT